MRIGLTLGLSLLDFLLGDRDRERRRRNSGDLGVINQDVICGGLVKEARKSGKSGVNVAHNTRGELRKQALILT